MMGLEHIRNIQLLPDAEITAVTDHSVEARESTRILIRNDGAPDVSLQDGMRSVMMGLAAEENMRTGKVVKF